MEGDGVVWVRGGGVGVPMVTMFLLALVSQTSSESQSGGNAITQSHLYSKSAPHSKRSQIRTTSCTETESRGAGKHTTQEGCGLKFTQTQSKLKFRRFRRKGAKIERWDRRGPLQKLKSVGALPGAPLSTVGGEDMYTPSLGTPWLNSLNQAFIV